MIKQSFMDKLLDGVSVELKRMQDIAVKISSGGTPRTGVADYYNGNIPWLRTQEVDFCDIWDTGVKITESGLNNSSAKMIPANCVIVAMYGATVGKISINKIPLCTNQACANIQLDSNIANYRYVFHYLMSKYEYIKSLGSGSQTNINAKIVKNLEIPIPCPDNPVKSLEIQQEIVRILDNFTELTAELTAELAARKKQYSYYRDKLLSFEDGDVEWKVLGDVGEVIRGNGMQKKHFTEKGFPAVHYGQIYTKYGLHADETYTFVSNELAEKLRIARKNDLLIATTSENDEDLLKPVAWLGEKAAISGDMMMFKHNENVKYLAYYFQTESFQKQKRKYITGAKVRRISKDNIEKMIVPIPKDPNEQERIVTILDKFDTLTTSISEGLPHEIELRQKQYEYYRDMLLSFPKDKVKNA